MNVNYDVANHNNNNNNVDAVVIAGMMLSLSLFLTSYLSFHISLLSLSAQCQLRTKSYLTFMMRECV